ncbi:MULTISPECIES: very short patch repair endonuclease [Janthinobacterium]|uniref:very short patch repair endonuclease n=1 Tax=Janthinobacterium TaxID=29580 RepID=UPI0027B944F6|nr:very short patch repair endonuclease [Janthinobacterium sp. BJB301]
MPGTALFLHGFMRCIMVDTIDQPSRSRVMARVKGKNTGPELLVRKLVFAAGYRYRIHVKNLPGSPDLTFPRRKKVIFVHGCFWHRHEGCDLARMPKSRIDFWDSKLSGNKLRDARAVDALRQCGWDVMVVWECELRDPQNVAKAIQEFLGAPCRRVLPEV